MAWTTTAVSPSGTYRNNERLLPVGIICFGSSTFNNERPISIDMAVNVSNINAYKFNLGGTSMWKKVGLVIVCVMFSAGFALAAETGGKAKAEDFGKQPWVVDIEDLTKTNENFRTAKWTGKNLQMTVMSVKPRGEIGLEKHDKGDQFIRVEEGEARVVMGISKDKMTFDKKISDNWAIFIPEGFWHNILNVGDKPLKVYVIYAPPEHPAGTVHKTFEEGEVGHGK